MQKTCNGRKGKAMKQQRHGTINQLFEKQKEQRDEIHLVKCRRHLKKAPNRQHTQYHFADHSGYHLRNLPELDRYSRRCSVPLKQGVAKSSEQTQRRVSYINGRSVKLGILLSTRKIKSPSASTRSSSSS